MALGGKGVVATVSNVMPRETHELAAAALVGDYEQARELHYRLLPLARALLVETGLLPDFPPIISRDRDCFCPPRAVVVPVV
jgi:4-hydroxy-tetrahydrodipicolinate synthase